MADRVKTSTNRKSRGFEESPQLSLFEQPPKIGSEVARSNSIYKIGLTEKDLFGEDDAAYVKFELLESYSLERKECVDFFDSNISFFAVRAPKGTGKTTMVRLLESELSQQKNTTALLRFDSNISPSLDTDASLSEWITEWKKNICEALVISISGQDSFSLDPKLIRLAERSSEKGKEGRRFSDLAKDYLRPLETNSADDSYRASQKLVIEAVESKADHQLWLFLDEIDQHFSNEIKSINKVGAMFLAAREMSGYVDNLNIRITIKPNVFAVLENNIDSMSNLRDYVFDLEWDNNSIRQLLAKRVESFLDRNIENRYDERLLHGASAIEREEWLISQIFYTKEFDLGKGNRPPHEILGILSDRRPRWLLSLCKIAAKIAKNNKYELVHFKHVKDALNKFGNNTITDICSEYKTQCAELPKIINRFNGAPSKFTSYAGLIDYIDKRISRKMAMKIAGVSDHANPAEIAEFLYYIGFLDARKDISNKKKKHIHAHERPELMSAQFNDEYDDYYWEIRPTFRDYLNIGRPPNNQIPRNRRKK